MPPLALAKLVPSLRFQRLTGKATPRGEEAKAQKAEAEELMNGGYVVRKRSSQGCGGKWRHHSGGASGSRRVLLML